MFTGSITNYIDVAQLVLYAFWFFFGGLVWYLHRENKREGYPLVSDRSERVPRVPIQGFPAVPPIKTYKLARGGESTSGRPDLRPVNGRAFASHPGAPIEPVGDPMLAGVGPGSYAEREDVPDRTEHGGLKIVPLRVATDHWIPSEDPDPRGLPVYGADDRIAGKIVDAWVDRSEVMIRYLEIGLKDGGGTRMIPMNFARVDGGRRLVEVGAILSSQFAAVPTLKNADQITFLEEEKVMAYYGAGTLYATPDRQEPLL